jgi:hypothetical protein
MNCYLNSRDGLARGWTPKQFTSGCVARADLPDNGTVRACKPNTPWAQWVCISVHLHVSPTKLLNGFGRDCSVSHTVLYRLMQAIDCVYHSSLLLCAFVNTAVSTYVLVFGYYYYYYYYYYYWF